jgi:hypothetical protein
MIVLVPLLGVGVATTGDQNDDLIRDQMRTDHNPGLVVVAADYGTVTENRTCGLANAERETPMTLGSVLALASVTWPCAAMAVMREASRLRALDPGSTDCTAPHSGRPREGSTAVRRQCTASSARAAMRRSIPAKMSRWSG